VIGTESGEFWTRPSDRVRSGAARSTLVDPVGFGGGAADSKRVGPGRPEGRFAGLTPKLEAGKFEGLPRSLAR
jgi:hypothetical protein